MLELLIRNFIMPSKTVLQVIILCISISSLKGYLVTMITRGERYEVAAGDSVSLLCDFHAEHYNLFDYPVLWKKMQHGEESRINIMGNINPPFVDSRRFEVSYAPNPPRYKLSLYIADVSTLDSGNYTCEVRGLNSMTLSQVTHRLFVRAAVRDLQIQANNFSRSAGGPARDTRLLTFIEDRVTQLRCVAAGGFPVPRIQLRIGKRDITQEFKLTIQPRMSGVKGLRNVTYTTVMSSANYMPSAQDDGRKLKCTATVPGMESNTTFVRLDIRYSPKITCYNNGAYIGERTAFVRCEVRAKPAVRDKFWLLDENGTKLSDGDAAGYFFARFAERADEVWEAKLYIRSVDTDNFRKYLFVAENDVARTERKAELFQKFLTTSPRPTEFITEKYPSKQSRSNRGGYTYFHSSATFRTAADRRLVFGLWIYVVFVSSTKGDWS